MQLPNELSKSEPAVDFIDHINHWLEYLAALYEKADEETRPKWERQIRYLLAFRSGVNCNIHHNFLLLHYYSNKAKCDNENILARPESGGKERKIKPEVQAKVDDFIAEFRLHAHASSSAIRAQKPLQSSYTQDDLAFKLICQALECEDLFFLQGPPGTGKTTAIVEIILQTLHSTPQARILVTSESHVAVDNALDRLAGVSPQLLKSILRYPRFRITEFECDSAHQADALEQVKALWHRQPALLRELRPYAERDDGTSSIAPWQARNLAEMHQVIGVTCNQIEHLVDDDAPMFDLAIVDECSKATMPEWLMAMSVAKKCILVGDHKQLPPVFCEEESDVLDEMEEYKERLIRNGVIDRLFENLPASLKGILHKQYRMLPAIGTFVSESFYDGKLENHRELTDHWFTQFGWITYKSGKNKVPAQTGSERKVLVNETEILIVMDVLATISLRCKNDGIRKLSVALITPYKAQCRMLREAIKKHDFSATLSVEIDTVDAFQGRQADIVIFSFVRTTGPARFYADPRRMNVAISRARDAVYLVGDIDYIKSKHLHVLDALSRRPVLIEYVQSKGIWHSCGSHVIDALVHAGDVGVGK